MVKKFKKQPITKYYKKTIKKIKMVKNTIQFTEDDILDKIQAIKELEEGKKLKTIASTRHDMISSLNRIITIPNICLNQLLNMMKIAT